MDEEENESPVAWTREKHAEMSQRLGNLIEELVRTERSYLLRIQALKKVRLDLLWLILQSWLTDRVTPIRYGSSLGMR